MYPVYICVFLHESADDNATAGHYRKSKEDKDRLDITEKARKNSFSCELLHMDTPVLTSNNFHPSDLYIDFMLSERIAKSHS